MLQTMLAREYRTRGTLAQFHASDAFARGLMGPVGSGKSTACAMEIFERARQQAPDSEGVRKTRWAVIRNTYPDLRTTTLKTWKEWFPEHLFSINYTSPITCRLKGALGDGTHIDAEVIFIALDKPKDVRKLLSLEITGAWLNEAR